MYNSSKIFGLFFVLLAICFLGLPAQAQYGGGTGEPNDPYLIYTAEQMNAIGANPNDWDKHFKLMADIDLSAYTGTAFNIIGSSDTFRGVFDGNGKKISNFNYTSTDANGIGLFSNVRGVIKDLGLINPNIDAGTGSSVGSLVGFLNIGTISNCYAEGASVSGYDYVGGLVGYNGGTITNCYSSGNVSAYDTVGGLVGESQFGTITNCNSSASVSRGSGGGWVGGLVGGGSIITNCYATGSVWGTGFSVGGLVGANLGTITNCYATGSVSGTGSNVGGLAGDGGTTTNCYATGSVSGVERVGGLVGYVGYGGAINNCYSVGRVTGTTDVGGLVGNNWGEVTDSFWDTQTSGQATSAGGRGKTTAEMQTESTFTDAGWDFVGESVNGTEDIWWILEGQDYPRLWWELIPEN